MGTKIPSPTRNEEKHIRSLLAMGMLAIFGTALLASLTYGMITRDYNAIEKVALTMGGPMGYVLGYYMGQRR